MRDELIADAEMGENRATEVAGEEDCTEDGGAGDQVDRKAGELQDAEGNRQRDVQLHVIEAFRKAFGLDELHDGAKGEEERGDSSQESAYPDSHA